MTNKDKKEYSFVKMLLKSGVLIFILYQTNFFAYELPGIRDYASVIYSKIQNENQNSEEEEIESSEETSSSIENVDVLQNESLAQAEEEFVEIPEVAETELNETFSESCEQESYEQESCEQKSYEQESYEQESYEQESCEQESREQEQEQEEKIADPSYFNNSLFIGDSRTVGLYEYGNLQGATAAAATGMNVYQVFETKYPMKDGTEKTLEEIVKENQFGKVYIMLGINELGYDFDTTIRKYGELVQWIQNWQPYALIYLQANLHVTGEKSLGSPYVNNENINRMNEAIKSFADDNRIFYIDVNPIFDDGQGGLAEEYTVDHCHIKAKYYEDWVNWLLTEAR